MLGFVRDTVVDTSIELPDIGRRKGETRVQGDIVERVTLESRPRHVGLHESCQGPNQLRPQRHRSEITHHSSLFTRTAPSMLLNDTRSLRAIPTGVTMPHVAESKMASPLGSFDIFIRRSAWDNRVQPGNFVR